MSEEETTLPPASRTKIATVAARLQADGTIINGFANDEPAIKRITIKVDALLAFLTATITPIVYGNYRGLGVRSVTATSDVDYLDSVIYTVATNAVQACYAVGFTKTQKVNYGSVLHYGGRPEVDKFTMPALTALFINSFGPITRARESYRCTFVPILNKTNVDALRAAVKYDPRKEEMFRLSMQRAHYSITMSDIDINNEESSHWWTLHVVQTTPSGFTDPTHQTVYSPISFTDLDNATTLAGAILSATLYDFPGPIHTARIGPFVTHTGASTPADIPAALRDDIGFNVSPPVRLFEFEASRPATQADVIAFGPIQSNTAITNLGDPVLRNPGQALLDLDTDHRNFVRNLDKWYASQDSSKQAKSSANSTTITVPTGNKRSRSIDTRPDPVYAIKKPSDLADKVNGYSLFTVKVYYFDCVILDNFPLSRTESIITEAQSV
uniref:Uncharacterized protein n=1 Tax=viral metagenome TaxID=1070528 RepID=A0A2V0RAT9_9ZZZZ